MLWPHCDDPVTPQPDAIQFSTFEELLEATSSSMHWAAGNTGDPGSLKYQQTETNLLRRA